MDDSLKQTVPQLRRELAFAEREILALRDRLERTEHTAALARKSAQEAWAFSRIAFHGRPVTRK